MTYLSFAYEYQGGGVRALVEDMACQGWPFVFSCSVCGLTHCNSKLKWKGNYLPRVLKKNDQCQGSNLSDKRMLRMLTRLLEKSSSSLPPPPTPVSMVLDDSTAKSRFQCTGIKIFAGFGPRWPGKRSSNKDCVSNTTCHKFPFAKFPLDSKCVKTF